MSTRLSVFFRFGFAIAGCASLTLAAQAPPSHPFAQKLVEQAQTQHSDITEIGILLPQGKSCTTIASTDREDLGEKCEADDTHPLETGKPSVGKEGDAYTVSMLLHDQKGQRVGVIGIEMKQAGHTQASALAEAQQIERAMAKQIPSKQRLAQP